MIFIGVALLAYFTISLAYVEQVHQMTGNYVSKVPVPIYPVLSESLQ